MDTLSQRAVTWMVDGVAVDTSPSRISSDGGTLSFSPLATSDTGNYTCTLTVNVSQTYVTVQGPEQSEMEDVIVQGIHDEHICNTFRIRCVLQSPSLLYISLLATLLLCILVLASLSHVL